MSGFWKRFALMVTGLSILGGAASAGTVTFDGSTVSSRGAGFGNVTNVLSLQQQGNGSTEGGAVSWNGTNKVITEYVASSVKPSSTQTITVGTLTSQGIDATNLAVIFNLNQNNTTSVNLQSFKVTFFNAAGSLLGDATFTPGLPNAPTTALEAVDQGTGGAGYVFVVNLSAAEQALFFGNASNRLGLDVSLVSNANDGIDNFYLDKVTPSVVTPEPGAFALALTGLATLGLARLRRARESRVQD